MTAAKRWIRWVTTVAAVCLFGAMLYVFAEVRDSRAGYAIIVLLIVCSFLYKWASRP